MQSGSLFERPRIHGLIELGPARATWLLRVGLGVVFLWFGALKLFPGVSPAEPLVVKTVQPFVDPQWFLRVLAMWECAIGLGMLLRWRLRITLLLMSAHMCGTFLPLVVCPREVWTVFPHILTLEGQYIFKNLVLMAAGVMVACGCPRPPIDKVTASS